MERDRHVDGEGRRPDATLGPVEGDDVPERRARGALVSGREAGEEAPDPCEKLGRVERLHEVVVRARPQALDPLLDVALGRQHDDRDVGGPRLVLADPLGYGIAIELRQHDVEEHERGALGLPEPDRFDAVGGDARLEALLSERV